MNLDSTQDTPIDAFDPTNPSSYNNATSISVYDERGNQHVIQTFYVKNSGSAWDVFAAVDGTLVGTTAAAPVTNPAGTVVSAASTDLTAIPANTFSINGVNIGALPAAADAVARAADLVSAINAAGITGVTAADDSVPGPGTGIVTITNTVPAIIGMNGTAADAATATANLNILLAQTGLTAAQVGTQAIAAQPMGTLNFAPSGELTGTTVFTIPVTVTTGATSPFPVTFDYSGTTSFGSAFSVNALTQDGYTSGRLSGFDIGTDGIITGRYTNGKSSTLGQIVLANFTNPNGLQPLGNNVWAETSTSGAALVSTPNSGTLGVLQQSAVEDSNVDLTAELVNMITAQRYYQANAQTIKAQDQILQTLVNLR